MLLAEAAGIDSDELRPFFKRQGTGAGVQDTMWEFVTSADKNLAVGVRTSPGMYIKKLYDSTDVTTPLHRDYSDDPCTSKATEKTLWYMICEIEYGDLPRERQQGHGPVTRSDRRPAPVGDRLPRCHMTKIGRAHV